MARIERIDSYEVLDSRGDPTVRVLVHLAGGYSGSATVPSGASTGAHEAHELRDGNELRYRGKGVLNAVDNIHKAIQPALLGKDAARQEEIDALLIEIDGTPNKLQLGANAILAVSLACACAQAHAESMPLYRYLNQMFGSTQMSMPIPQLNVVNGGQHASSGLSIQEFHIVPAGAIAFGEGLRMGSEIYHVLKEIFLADGYQVEVGDEGGFAPPIRDSETVFTYLIRAIEKAGYRPGYDVFLGIDVASSEFYNSERELYLFDGAPIDAQQLSTYYQTWCQRYPLISIEDPFDQDDWLAWEKFMQDVQNRCQVVGDDLFATNPKRVQEGISRKAANAVLVKVNQIGTLSEALSVVKMAQSTGMNVVISHRSGETEDTFIADLSVAVGAGQIKTGAPARSERTAKYNRLLEIEHELEDSSLGDNLNRFIRRIDSATGEVVSVAR